jgi:hypothetical protein
MSIQQKLKHELKAVILVTLFFVVWLGFFMALKVIVLGEYDIQFGGISKVLIGALILAKVVLILEHVSLGAWLRNKPMVLDVILSTSLYAVSTLVVMLFEKAFESRHEQGGFGSALTNVFQQRDMPHFMANFLCVSVALLFYNLRSSLNLHPGTGGLERVFLSLPRQNASTP